MVSRWEITQAVEPRWKGHDKGKMLSVALVQYNCIHIEMEVSLQTSSLYHPMHYKRAANNFLCYQIFVLTHDFPSVNGISAYLCAKCLMHEAASCWCWPAADLHGSCQEINTLYRTQCGLCGAPSGLVLAESPKENFSCQIPSYPNRNLYYLVKTDGYGQWQGHQGSITLL